MNDSQELQEMCRMLAERVIELEDKNKGLWEALEAEVAGALELMAERNQACAWAAAWRHSARSWREEARATEEMRAAAVGEMEHKDAEIKRLRQLLQQARKELQDAARATLKGDPNDES